jgi:hypothetical protein
MVQFLNRFLPQKPLVSQTQDRLPARRELL